MNNVISNYIQLFIHRENGQCMALEHINMTIKSSECPKTSGSTLKWDIIQISESNSTYKIINGHSRGCLIIDGKVPKSTTSARCDEESNTWILNQATSIGKFSVKVSQGFCHFFWNFTWSDFPMQICIQHIFGGFF